MPRFRNLNILDKAFYSGCFTEGHTGSKCSNYNTNFKTDWKYKFVANVYYENGRAIKFINRTFKCAIHIVDFQSAYCKWTTANGYTHLYIYNDPDHVEYIAKLVTHNSGFLQAMRYCAAINYLEQFGKIKQAIQYGRKNTAYYLQPYLLSCKLVKEVDKMVNSLAMKYRVINTVSHINLYVPVIKYRGFKKTYHYVKTNCRIDRVIKSHRLTKDDYIKLIAKSVYYSDYKHYVTNFSNLNYKSFMKFALENPTILSNIIWSFVPHIHNYYLPLWIEIIKILRRYSLDKLKGNLIPQIRK